MNESDPTGLSWYDPSWVNSTVDSVGNFFSDPSRWRDEANYWAGFANGIVSTFTFGQEHVAAPYCDALSFAYGVGDGFGYATAAVGTATAAGAVLRIVDVSGAPVIGRSSVLFGRGGGLLNSNDIIRLGWGWVGSATTGQQVFRLAIGNSDAILHWHLDLF